MQSLNDKFNGKSDQVLQDTRLYGQFMAERKYQVGHIAFVNWLEKKTGDRNYGVHPLLGSGRSIPTAKELVQEFRNTVVELQTIIKQKDQEIAELKMQLDYHTARKAIDIEGTVSDFMAECETARVRA